MIESNLASHGSEVSFPGKAHMFKDEIVEYAENNWKLLHSFQSNDGVEPYPDDNAIGVKGINTEAKLNEAGISHYIGTYNTSYYTLISGYAQLYYSSSPYGYIDIPLPVGFNKVKIEWGNWYTGSAWLDVGGVRRQTLYSNHGATVYEGDYSEGDSARLTENGIFWIKAIWVKR